MKLWFEMNYFFVALEQRTTECTRCEPKSPPVKRKPPPEQEAATSTTPADAPINESPISSVTKAPTHEWTIEDVIQFIEESDPCLGIHADLFRKHVSKIFTKLSYSILYRSLYDDICLVLYLWAVHVQLYCCVLSG